MEIRLKINGENYQVTFDHRMPISTLLSTFLRSHLQLTGTKVMCGKGGCGVCVVTIGRAHPATKAYETFAINACLRPLFTCDGAHITTVEGLGNYYRGYHPLQSRLIECGGAQCGYCTSGMIMNMHGQMAANKGSLNMLSVERSFSGNLCRCTGYRPILDAMKSFARDASSEDRFGICERADLVDIEDLVANSTHTLKPFTVTASQNKVWHRVVSLPVLLDTLKHVSDRNYTLVAGNTAQGVSPIPGNIHTFIEITSVSDLHEVYQTDDSLTIGALATLSETIAVMTKASGNKGFEYLSVLVEYFENMANLPVRNVGTMGGNLSYKQRHPEFPSHVFVALDTIDAHLTILDCDQHQTVVTMTEFLALDMHQKVIVNSILPRLADNDVCRTYAVAIRAQNAHAYVNAGFYAKLDGGRVISARICYSGINPNCTHASDTEALLVGSLLHTNQTLQEALGSLNNELTPNWQPTDAHPEYRKRLALAFFYRFILDTSPVDNLSPLNASAAKASIRHLSSGMQSFKTTVKNWPLTQPAEKYEGLKETSGESKFINDMPRLHGELWCAFAVATNVSATVVAIDAAEALAATGVRFFIAAKDIPGKNNFTPRSINTTVDEQIFLPIGGRVLFHGQPVGVVLADSQEEAIVGADRVAITYEFFNKHKVSIIARTNNFLRSFRVGGEATFHPKIGLSAHHLLQHTPENQSATTNDATTIKGYIHFQGQYHFHMETQCAVAVPDEMDLTIYCSTQAVDFTQYAVSECLAMPANRIHFKLSQIGGAYGAKLSRSAQIACTAALGSFLTNRPVRFSMTLEANMKSIGKRSGTMAEYGVQVDATTGRIWELSNNFVQDAGCSLNEPFANNTKVAFSNCYDSQGWRIDGDMALTDAPSNTFCRGPSALEGIGMVETVMEHIAAETGLDAMAVRVVNMAVDSPLRQISADFVKSIDFARRQTDCAHFNATNRWKKRGIAVLPMKWPQIYLGSISAFVAIYHHDGTVAITHGGIECGQGINTKVAQVAAYALGIPLASISVKPTNNVQSANSLFTGTSSTSEMCCYAILMACNVLLERIRPIRTTMPVGYTWPQLIAQCYAKSIELVANGQFDVTDLETYCVYGMAAAEVELDVLTGVCQIERVDIWEDVGESMSPKVDVGQVEGAFVMGIGYFLTEELIYDRITGELLTDDTWTYKPPGALDIPIDFRVTFIQNSPNPNAGVLRSKATGEPAIAMSIVVLFALRNAINSARNDAGLEKTWIALGSATTPEKISLTIDNDWSQFML